ncbi:LysR family transcriptional regulator [Mannheimia sp. HC-2023]|uniref:LysR family transcriptional regulator n=1 Tax=Mannheimia indoligenes TaxID=3103145 RepID=UPI002FE620BC
MNAKNTTIHAFEIFLAVAREKNFSEVARQYNVASSVISRQIKQLEDDFGQTLFYRSTRAMSLTQAGETFATHAHAIVSQFCTLSDELDSCNREPSGIIRINAPVAFGKKHVIPYLAEFAKRYPKLIINLTQTDQFVDPYSETADIIFRVAALNDSNLKLKVIAKQRFLLLASPDYLAEFGTPQKIADLANHRGLIYRGQLGLLRWREMATQQVIKVQESFVSNNGNSLIEMAVAGNGIVMMPDWAVYDEIRSGKLVPILPDTPIASDNQEIYVAILTPLSAYRPINVQAVMDFFVEKWEEGKAWQV